MLPGVLLCLLLMVFQDWKNRTIHVALPLLVFVLSLLLIKQEYSSVWMITAYNAGFFLITFVILILYMSWKNKQFLNPFEHYFGLGDLLFYLAITPLFLLKNYVVYFIFSMLFSIVLQLGLKKIMKHRTIPLAGFASLLLLILMAGDLFLNFYKITLIPRI
ncbi:MULTISPECIES: prepilin peptidase [unclassified Flavobacterium]|uniref:prepilin peptidase n=1 Tax=unclassified Flavobacterium TaxID=196869 RepID=UPI000AAF354E|nr:MULTISPECIES: prepilin peptidase [unclassified Flavobacterium]MBN9285313.1 prepilin peptidase [Flavobacterium sp.]